MNAPLLVVGAARSGTTLVGERLLGSHPEVLYWSEPAFVWRYGNAYKLHDMLRPEDGRAGVKRRIRLAFERKAAERPNALLVEKTPANTFRMPFVLSVMPEAKILHVIRDGRQATRSARDEWAGLGKSALDSAHIRRQRTVSRLLALVKRDLRPGERYVGPMSLLELPAYGPRSLGFLLRQALHVSWLPWGARFPGIVRARWQLGVLEVAAMQWHLSVHLTRSACARLGPHRYHEVRFEDLQSDPEGTLETIRAFTGLAPDPEWMGQSVGLLRPRHVDADAGLSNDEVMRIEELCGATLTATGYELVGGRSDERSPERSMA